MLVFFSAEQMKQKRILNIKQLMRCLIEILKYLLMEVLEKYHQFN